MWETVRNDAGNGLINRLAVPGGWIYVTMAGAAVFVPEPNNGFADGDNHMPSKQQGGEWLAQGEKVPPPSPSLPTKEMVDLLSEAMDLYLDGEVHYAERRIYDVIHRLEGKS